MNRISPASTACWANDIPRERAASAGLHIPSLGLLYILCVPLVAGVATVRQVSIAGFNYSGVLWVIEFVIGVLLLLFEKGMRPERRSYFPIGPWFVWLAYMGASFAWLEAPSYLQVQYAMQLSMPLLVGVAASLFVRSRHQLEQLVRAYFFSLLVLIFFVGLCLAGTLSQDEQDPVFVAVRPLSLTAVVIGGLFAAGSKRQFTRSWIGWAACLTLTVFTGSRMATVAMLLLPILNPVTRSALPKAAAIMVVGLLGVAVYRTSVFQERFFRGESGGISQIVAGDFDSSGRFESWPLVLEEALKCPWLGHGVGSVQVFLPEVWPEVSHPCNDYLRVAYEFGSVGLVLFFGVLGWQLWNIGRRIGRTSGVVQQAFGGAWLGLAIFLPIAFTDNPIVYHVWYMNPVFALLGAAYAVARKEELDSDLAQDTPCLPHSGAPRWRSSRGINNEEPAS